MNPKDRETLSELTETLTALLQGHAPHRIPPVAYDGENHELAGLSNSVNSLVRSLTDSNAFITALAQGNISVAPPAKTFLISPFKQLQAALRHLTWQTQQIANGDLNQKVNFMGEYSAAFNTLIASLREKKQTEEALGRSEKQLRDITSSLSEGIYVWDREGDIIFMNPEAERLLGWTMTELKSRKIHDTVHYRRADGSYLPFEECAMHKVIETGEPLISMDEVFISKDGTEFPISVVANPIFDGGRIVAGVTAFRNISHLKQTAAERDKAQAALRDHANFLQGLIDAIPNPIFYKNAQLLYIGCNAAFAEYMGLAMKDIIGKSVYDLAPPDLARLYNKRDVELLTDSRYSGQAYEATVKHADGSVRDVIFNKAVFFHGDGSVGGLIGVIIDITKRKSLEKEREQLIGRLQETLAQVKQLSGLLPICSSCKKIRDDKGYWSQIESYISEHSEALFTHSVCPECAKQLYPQFYDDIWRGKENESG